MFYPKSQIKTNLYTNGEEYILSTTGEAYIGYYFATSTGKKYTGKTPQDGINILLIKPTPTLTTSPTEPSLSNEIVTYKNEDYSVIPPNRIIPQYNPTIPTEQDKSLGVFQRYFCKKNNELIYIEIDQNTFNLLQSKSSTIAWDLYTPLSTLWYIKGNKEQTYKANKGLITLIEQNQKWYGFTQWFQDKFLKYYLES
jgi:hypothetical protein